MIEVLKPGFYSLIQDAGRFGFQEFGMPISGVLDMDSYRLANWLVANVLGEAVLEITLIGPKLVFHKDTFIGLTGADMSPEINGENIEMYATIKVLKGSVLTFGKLRNGCRCYLAVANGFDVSLEMGSRSTYAYAYLGGMEGRELYKNDFLKTGKMQQLRIKKVPKQFHLQQFSSMSIRVIDGPESDSLSRNDVALFLKKEFTVSHHSNRMGCRLEGVSLKGVKKEMISSGIVNGTVQLPANGNPIILLVEAQTTGGYPRVAIVIKLDLSILAQVKPGDKLRFRKVSIGEAQANWFNKEKLFQGLLKT